MTTQPEYILEENLVEQLQDLGYTKVNIKDEDELVTRSEEHTSELQSQD